MDLCSNSGFAKQCGTLTYRMSFDAKTWKIAPKKGL